MQTHLRAALSFLLFLCTTAHMVQGADHPPLPVSMARRSALDTQPANRLKKSTKADKPAAGKTSPLAPFNAKEAQAFQQQWAKHIAKPLVLTNAIGMKLTLIPPGEFRMGVGENDTYPRLLQNMLKNSNRLESNPPKHGRRTCKFPESSIAGDVCREAAVRIAVSDTVRGG